MCLYGIVTVELDHSPSSQTALAKQHQGCTIDTKFYPEGTQVSVLLFSLFILNNTVIQVTEKTYMQYCVCVHCFVVRNVIIKKKMCTHLCVPQTTKKFITLINSNVLI